MSDASRSEPEPKIFERLFEAAEVQAQVHGSPPSAFSALNTRHDHRVRHDLAAAAKRDLERRQRRHLFLPAELRSDVAWTALLDVYISDQTGQSVRLSVCGPRWGLSDATAIRQAAALVAADFLERESGGSGDDLGVLRLSRHGRQVLSSILEGYP